LNYTRDYSLNVNCILAHDPRFVNPGEGLMLNNWCWSASLTSGDMARSPSQVWWAYCFPDVWLCPRSWLQAPDSFFASPRFKQHQSHHVRSVYKSAFYH